MLKRTVLGSGFGMERTFVMVALLAKWMLMSLSEANAYAECQSRVRDSRYVQGVGFAVVEKDRQRHWTSSSLGSLVSLVGAARTVVVDVKVSSSERSNLLEENMTAVYVCVFVVCVW